MCFTMLLVDDNDDDNQQKLKESPSQRYSQTVLYVEK